MSAFEAMVCEACRAGAPPATAQERADFLQAHPGWEVVEADGEPQVRRVFKFPDFKAALAFTNRVGELAERENHHPALLTEWGRVTVRWWTHKIRGLHRNDLILAARTDALAGEASPPPR
jgi:4a-hydroxytetrahydrobiopterin dehydratase